MCDWYWFAYSSAWDFGLEIPVDALAEENGTEPICVECKCVLTDFAYLDDDTANVYCESCLETLVESLKDEARVFAKKNCRFTRELPTFYLDHEYRCTPEEYAEGMRESYTENSYRCHCRHCCTNYEELIVDYSKCGVRNRVFYAAIRSTIDKMIDDDIVAKDLIRYSPEDDDPASEF